MTLTSNPPTVNRNFAFILFYDNNKQQFVTGEEWNAYAQRYMEMFLNLEESDLIIKPDSDVDSTKKMLQRDAIGMDLIEYGIINALTPGLDRISNAPSVTLEIPYGQISTGGGSIDDSIKVTQAEIRSKFSDNAFFKKYTAPTLGLALPARGKMERTVYISQLAPRMRRTISVTNTESTVDIFLSWTGGNLTPAIPDIFGRREPGGGPIDDWYWTARYSVEIKGGLNNFWPISWKRKESLKRWHEDIAAVLEKFDWKSVNAQLKEERTQKALDLILETNKRRK